MVALSASLGLLTSSCGESCDHWGVAPQYQIHVKDKTTGKDVCDAVVNILGGHLTSKNCTYTTPIPENYPSVTVTIAHPAYQTLSKDVSTAYQEDECGHAQGVHLNFELEPR